MRVESRLGYRDALFDLLHDFLIHIAFEKLFADANGIFYRPAFAAAVADQTIPTNTQQRSTAIFLPIVPGINLLHRRLELFHGRRAGLLQLTTKLLEQALGEPFDELEHDVA